MFGLLQFCSSFSEKNHQAAGNCCNINNFKYFSIMKQIADFSCSGLTVGSHLDFHMAVLGYITSYTPAKLKIEQLVPQYQTLLGKEQQIVQRPTSQRYTQQLSELDGRRDDALSVITGLIKAYTRSLKNDKRTAALELKSVADPYWYIARNAYQKESQQIIGLLAALELPENKAHVATLGIADEVESLKEAQEAFAAVYEKSREDATARMELESVDTRELRASVDAAFQQIALYVNANTLLSPTDDLTGFVDKVNGAIYRARQEAGQSHTTGGKGDGGSDSGESPDPIQPGGGGDDGDGESPDPIV